MNRRSVSIIFPVCMILVICLAATGICGPFEKGLSQLTDRSFSKKTRGLETLVASRDARVEELLSALMDGSVYYVKKGKQVVFVRETGDTYEVTPVLGSATRENVGRRAVKKIGINNSIRKKIKSWMAVIRLSDPDPSKRIKAVQVVMASLDEDILAVISDQAATERDDSVKAALNTALSLGILEGAAPGDKALAIKNLRGELHPAVKNGLTRFLNTETDPELKATAQRTLQGIESRISLYGFFETLFFGLSAGSILVLAAIGLAITFGVIGVINMAHGELIMVGAYTTYVIQMLMPDNMGVGILLAVPAAFVVSGLTGIVIERCVIRFLYGRPLETLLATFGISLVLQQAVRSIFSPLNRAVSTPDWMSGSLYLNPVLSLTMNRIVIFVFCLLVFAGLFLVMKRTRLGLQVRAVSQNRPMARAMGVRAARVDALTFGLGSGIAGVAGVALSQLTNVGPNLGQAYIIDSFMVVVFGGVGNLWGTLLAGLTLGTANKFIEPFSGAVLAKILVLVFIILFIQKRPQGLFPQKGRAAG